MRYFSISSLLIVLWGSDEIMFILLSWTFFRIYLGMFRAQFLVFHILSLMTCESDFFLDLLSDLWVVDYFSQVRTFLCCLATKTSQEISSFPAVSADILTPLIRPNSPSYRTHRCWNSSPSIKCAGSPSLWKYLRGFENLLWKFRNISDLIVVSSPKCLAFHLLLA